MGRPAVKLDAISEATGEVEGVAKQALEWVRVSEARVAEAEKSRAEIKQRAQATLGKIGEEGRERVAAERDKRRAIAARVARAEEGRNRAEQAFERAAKRAEADREAFTMQLTANKAQSDQAQARAVKGVEEEASKRTREVLEKAQAEADRRVAAAEQRAAAAEARAEEAHEIAVRLESEIEERVMKGTVEVRREAEERVRKLVEKVEGEAVEKAKVRAEEQLQAESERIRGQAEQREERLRRAAEDEIKASAKKARREVLAAADQTAPVWSRNESPSGAGYRTF
ncbi:MAG TPA: hypothetical protein VLK56_06145 [Solirubrobacterales bacterium]|nr:hypothetical protein [Solirubrobacterales bacterium]